MTLKDEKNKGEKCMNEWKRSLLTGTIVALASQLYWNVFVSGFRISPAVILLPILLMTIGKSISTIRITVTTAAVVFLFRLFLAASGLSSSPETAGQLATNSIFYLCYGLLPAAVPVGVHLRPAVQSAGGLYL